MANSRYKYTQFTERFKKALRQEMNSSDDTKDFGYDWDVVPKKVDMDRLLPPLTKILEISSRFEDLEKKYKVDLQKIYKEDMEKKRRNETTKNEPPIKTLKDYLLNAGKEYISTGELDKICDDIDDLISSFDKILDYFKANSERKESIFYGFLLLTAEKATKSVCDTIFEEGNPSSRTLLRALWFDLKRRYQGLGGVEYAEGSAMNGNFGNMNQTDGGVYREGGDGILKN